jgi:hypothetical protein
MQDAQKGLVVSSSYAVAFLGLTLLAGSLAAPVRAAEKPLTSDDVLLMLLAGASTDKMLTLIEQRGIDFRMNPDLAKKFHNAGADDLVIDALAKAEPRVPAAPAAAPSPAPPAARPPAAVPPAATPATADAPPPADTTRPVATATPAPSRPKAKLPPLADPSPTEIQKIIQEFAAKEKIFKEARNNYTYHQLNKLNELDESGNVVGVFQQEWDILFNDDGSRVERVTYAPPDTLKRIGVTKEDLDNMRSIQPFVLTTDELAEYDVKYLGHVRVDEITAYVFDVRPKEIKPKRLYFQGRVWVDDRDLQIVKSEGKTVPEMKNKRGENLFPRFTTYREQIDGKFWFPTYTIANDTLYFATGAVAIKQIIRYTDYKQFKAKVRILSTEVADAPETPASGTPAPKK